MISVHTPEFEFKKNLENVRWAAKDMGIDYPIAVDSKYAIWRAFGNEYWPALYFIDARWHIQHHQFGEGKYEQSENIIQQLLPEAGARDFSSELVAVDAPGAEAAPDLADLKSSENYLGLERTQNFTSSGGAVLAKRNIYVASNPLQLNHWTLAGDWTMQRPAAVLNEAGGRIVYRFFSCSRSQCHYGTRSRRNVSAISRAY